MIGNRLQCSACHFDLITLFNLHFSDPKRNSLSFNIALGIASENIQNLLYMQRK